MDIKMEKEEFLEVETDDAEVDSPNINEKSKKRYCDRPFKVQLARALKANLGEADNFDRIKSNKLLCLYDADKIIESTNNIAEDIQRSVENSIESQRTKEIINLARNVEELTESNNRPQEVPLLVKLNSVSRFPPLVETNNVNFDALNKFLYSSVSGSLDYVDMNYETKLVLHDTYNMLMEQVEKDAPQVLEELKSKMSGECDVTKVKNAEKLTEILQDSTLNPFNIPMEFLLHKKSSE